MKISLNSFAVLLSAALKPEARKMRKFLQQHFGKGNKKTAAENLQQSSILFAESLKKCENSYSKAKAFIVSNRWLRDCQFANVETGIALIIAEYYKGTEFGWDNFYPPIAEVSENGTYLDIIPSGPGAQRISSKRGFSRGVHSFKVKQLGSPGGCSRSLGITTDPDCSTKEHHSSYPCVPPPST